MSKLDVAQTILNQLGGAGVLTSMIGAKSFLGAEDYLQFRWSAKARNKANSVTVSLKPDDTYIVAFWSIRGRNMVPLSSHDGIHASSLVRLFQDETGLYIKL